MRILAALVVAAAGSDRAVEVAVRREAAQLLLREMAGADLWREAVDRADANGDRALQLDEFRALLRLPPAAAGAALGPNSTGIAGSDEASLLRLAASCPRADPLRVIYNRIPKCGSGSVNIFMKAAEERNRYTHARSTVYTTRWLSKASQRNYCENPFRQSQCRKQPLSTERAVLNRHIFYLDCAAHALAEPTYVNLVRDPIDRCISRFYYERDARGTVGATMTIDECMDRGKCKFDAWRMRESVADGGGHTRFNQLREECSSNYLARWFCGMDERCKSATGQELLERARVSVARKYAVVGSTARMAESLALMGAVLPSYFGGDPTVLEKNICNKCKANQTSPGGGPKISEKNQRALERINAVDVQLYAFIERFLDARLRACGVGADARAR